MKRIVSVTLLIVAAVSLDSVFEYFGIPIVTMDLIFVPLSIAIIVWVCSPSYLSGKYRGCDQAKSSNAYSKLGLIISIAVLLLFSIFMIFVGLSNPLELYIGVRGGGHGYTLSTIGLAMLVFVLSTTYVIVIKKCITK